MPKFEIPNADLKNLLAFLGRAPITGNEAPAMVRLAQLFSMPLPEPLPEKIITPEKEKGKT